MAKLNLDNPKGVTINGKIFRNTGGEEGIFIDGSPIGGGTQLYKHAVEMQNGTLNIISTDSTEVTTISSLQTMVSNSLRSSYIGNMVLSVFQSGPNTYSAIVITKSDGEVGRPQLGDSIISDTVTPL